MTHSSSNNPFAHQLKVAGGKQPLFDDTTLKGIIRKRNSLSLAALRLAASGKCNVVDETVMLAATPEALL